MKVPGTDWTEPVLAWLTISMPTGSGKSTLFRHLYSLLQEIRVTCGVTDEEPTWVFDDATFEKMGALMSENSCRLLGFYDEMSAFLTQINLYRGRGCQILMSCHYSYSSTMHIHGEGIQVSHLISRHQRSMIHVYVPHDVCQLAIRLRRLKGEMLSVWGMLLVGYHPLTHLYTHSI